MKQKIAALSLTAINLALIGAVALSTYAVPAMAQGVKDAPVKRMNKSVACPSGWKTMEDNSDYCEPQGSLAPKIYGKDDSETCASGYFEVYRYWCSTKKP